MDKTPKWRYGLPILAALALLTLLALPATRWLLRIQMSLGIYPSKEYAWSMQMLGIRDNAQKVDTSNVWAKMHAAVTRKAGNYEYALAGAILIPQHEQKWNSQDVIAALRELTEQYPHESSLYAHILRFGCMSKLRTGHNVEQNEVADRPREFNGIPQVLDTDALQTFAADAEKGMEMEPDNAYFPSMLAVARFGLNQDTQALEALHRATQCSRYEDYCSQEAWARFALAQEAFGDQTALTQIAQSASILFPHYAQGRSLARVAVYKAIETEKAGNTQDGITIRQDVMRLGSLMRRESRSFIGILVGIAIVSVGQTRPNGEFLGTEIEPPPLYGKEAADATQQRAVLTLRKRERFADFLKAQGRDTLATWVQQENEAGDKIKSLGQIVTERSVFGTEQIGRLAAFWCANLVTLLNAFWMLAFGLLALLLTRRKTTPKRKHLFYFLGLFGVAVYLLINNLPVMRAFSSMLTVLHSISTQPAQDFGSLLIGITIVGALTVPFLTMFALSVVSLCCGVPISTGIVRGFRGLGIPAACVLFLLYTASLALTVREENRAKQSLQSMMQHEGRYLAEIAEKTWPQQ